MRMPRKSILMLLCLSVFSVMAGSQPASIHNQIQQTYSFEPHLLSHNEQVAKSAVLDKFWSDAKAQRSAYVSALRVELADFHNPPFFLYDGSMLLGTLSDTHDDRVIELAAIAHCDLRDLQQREYFLQVHRMAGLGEDTTAAAFHLLDDPKFQVLIPEHALTLGQDYVLVYLLLPTDERFWIQPSIDRLSTEKNEVAQKSLITLLWYAQNSAADKAIADFAGDTTKPDANRKFAQQFAQRKSLGAKVGGEVLSLGSSEEALRKKRRERMKSVSDEALIDLDRYTIAINAKRK
jgi:hypothetical protein